MVPGSVWLKSMTYSSLAAHGLPPVLQYDFIHIIPISARPSFRICSNRLVKSPRPEAMSHSALSSWPKGKPTARRMAPEVGFEPTTNRLTADRSTTELLWIDDCV